MYLKKGGLRTGPPRAEKGMMVLFLPQFARWTARPRTEAGSPSLSRPSPPLSTHRSDRRPPSPSVLGASFPSPKIFIPRVFGLLGNITFHSSCDPAPARRAPSQGPGGQDPALRLVFFPVPYPHRLTPTGHGVIHRHQGRPRRSPQKASLDG